MNIVEYTQHRQIGRPLRGRASKDANVESLLEEKITKFLTNKPCSLSGHCRSTFIMDFSPNGSKVASTHGDHTVRVTDIVTGECVRTLQGHPRTPWCLAYHPSSSHILASGCLAGQVRIWDLYGQGCEVWQTENSMVIASMTFHPSDHVLVFAAGNTIYFWDWSKPEPFARCNTKHEYERIRYVRFDPLGHFLYTGISNNTAIHRDEVSTASLTSQEPSTSTSGGPGRLGVVYNNLMNCYQEYRHDRAMQHVAPRLHRDLHPDPATATAPDPDSMDVYPGLSDNPVLRPTSPTDAQYLSMARQYAADVTERNIHPASQPFSQLLRSPPTSQAYSLAVDAMASTADLGVNTRAFLGGDDSNSMSGDSYASSHSLSSSSSLTPLNDINTSVPARGISNVNRSHGGTNHLSCTGIVQNDIVSHISGADVNFGANETVGGVLPQSVEDLDDSETLLGAQISDLIPIHHLSTDQQEATTSVDTSIDEGPGPMSEKAVISRSGATSNSATVGASNLPVNFDSGFLNSTSSDPCLFGDADLSNVTHSLSDISADYSSSSNNMLSSETGFTGIDRQQTSIVTQDSRVSVTEVTACNVASMTSVASGTTVRTLPPYLRDFITEQRIPEFLHNRHKRENSGETKAVPGFQNIRDRLKRSIPLSPPSTACSQRPIRIIAASDCPSAVRLISASEAPTVNITTQRTATLTRPACYTTPTSTVNLVRAVTNSHTTSCNVQPTTTVAASCPISIPSWSFPVSTSGTRYTAVRTMDTRSTDDDALPPFRSLAEPFASTGMASLLSNYAPLVSTVVASTSSHASLFQNIYHNTRPGASHFGRHGNIQSGRIQANLSSVRTRPYFQSRAHYPSSIMGPYLESRGFSLPDTEQNNTVTNVGNQQSNNANMHRYVGVPPAISREQTASDTENELSSHLPSGPYFLPISEGQTRTYSSQSTQSTSSFDLSTDPLVSRRSTDSPRSCDSVTGHGSRPSSMAGTQPGSVDIEVDNNNVSTQRNNNLTYSQNLADNRTENHDSNNNTIPTQPPQDYVALRDNFVCMTDRIEREMGELNRRITALRERFNESLDALRQDQQRYRQLGQTLSETGTGPATSSLATSGENSAQLVAPTITATQLQDSQSDGDSTESAQSPESPYQNAPLSQPATLLETSLRSHHRGRQLVQENSRGEPHYVGAGDGAEGPHWRHLQRNYLHPHYSSSILDDTINRPNNAIQSAINRAIAGAFMGTGEPAVANNIINQTHRIQFWDFTKCLIPDISPANINIVVPHCKLHNDASCDISQSGTLLATFVPSHRGFPDDNILAVYSLLPESRGHCLYTKSFGPNAISISISPKNQYVMVGLAAKRLSWVFTSNQMVAQIFQFDKPYSGEMSMKHMKDILHPCNMDIRSHVSGNSARWLPRPGQGLVYGTNRGDLHLCKPGVKVKVEKMGSPDDLDLPGSSTVDGPSIRRNLMQMLGLSNANLPRTFSISTQTNVRGIRHSTTTQTDNSDSD